MKKTIPSILLAAAMMFNVDPGYDINSRNQLEASLYFTSQNAYFYVEDMIYQSDWQPTIELLASEFDKVIYPRMRELYASEWTPGIDSDKKITVLIAPMTDDAGGYFNSQDSANQPGSNQREMIYLNSNNIQNPLAKVFLAHEFQHLINFYQKNKLRNIEEEVWLNEALSEYASTVLGYDDDYLGSNLEKRVSRFLRDPSNSLVEWSNSPYDYAVVNLFMQYLAEQQGQEILHNILIKNSAGIDSIEDFTNIFTNWVIANYINDCDLDNKYCYQNENLDFKISPTANYALFPISSLSVGAFTDRWSPHWYKISGLDSNGKVLSISFNSENDFIIPIITVDKNNHKQISFLKKEVNINSFGKEINSVTIAPFSDQPGEFSFLAKVSDGVAEPIIELNPKETLIKKINEIKLEILKLQKQLLLVKITEIKQRIAELMEGTNGQIARR